MLFRATATSRSISTLRSSSCNCPRTGAATRLAAPVLLCLQLCCICCFPVAANSAPSSIPKPLDEVTAPYPAKALLRGVHGDVVIDVEVDETGRVVGVEVLEGHPLLAEAAVDAAREISFEPARNSEGNPVSGRTQLVYSFGPHMDAVLEKVDVVAEREQPEDNPRAVVTLDAEILKQKRGVDLATTLEDVPGVVIARGTAAASKPVVRGQPERRLLLIEGGVRHENQKWGVDHAPEIDPAGAGTIRVIKGPAGVIHGPDAVGGVILVEPAPMPFQPGLHGGVDLAVGTNATALYAGGRVEGMHKKVPGLSFRAEGNYLRSGPQTTPNYLLGNTPSQQWNLRAAVQYRTPKIRVKLRYRHYDLVAGVFYGVVHSTPEDFVAQLERQQPRDVEFWESDWNWGRPYQLVRHDQITAELAAGLDAAGELEVRYSFQNNHREEYDHARSYIEGAQYNFLLRTHTLDLNWNQPTFRLGLATGSGRVGLAGLFQEHVYDGLRLLPNHRSFGVGIFALERLTFGRGIVEFGARYDHLTRAAFFGRNPYESHIARGTLDPADCIEGEGRTRCPSSYNGGALAVGGVLHAVPGILDLKLDLSSASRFPNTDELFMNGSSPTFPVYALGSPNLEVETAWGISPTLSFARKWLHIEVSTHLTRINDYIYFAPELNELGAPHVDVTIRGAFPRYSFRAIEALFYGVDGHLEIGADSLFGLIFSGAAVRGRDVATWDHLVGVPPDRLRVAGRMKAKKVGALEDVLLEVNMVVVGTVKRRLKLNADLAPSPAAYTLVGGAVGAKLPLKRGELSLHIEAHNVLDTAYRETLSLLRYYADEPGRDIRIRLGFDF